MNDDEKDFFDKEKQEKALKTLEQKWTNRECECCGNNKWSASDYLSVSPRFEGGIVIGGAVAPYLSVICLNCGNTKHFNAVVLGILNNKEGKTDDR